LIYKPLDDFGSRAEEVARTLAPKPELLAIYRRVIETVDPMRIAGIQETYRAHADDFQRVGGFKYLDLPYWLADKVRVATALGLAAGRRRAILDIGMGAGHFAAVCQAMGHTVVGTDISVPLYDDICDALGVDRRIAPTRLRQPLGDMGLRFDLITVIGQIFHIARRLPKGEREHWSIDDWAFFLRDLVAVHMNSGGNLYLHLNPNRYPDGERLDANLMQWCENHGAVVDTTAGKIWFNAVAGGI
jgi:SAM-dependent methyltransferase